MTPKEVDFMKKSKRMLKLSLTAFLCVCLCIPFTMAAFAKSSATTPVDRTSSVSAGSQPSASQVSAHQLVIPKGAVVHDLSKEPPENSNEKAGAVTVPAKELPSGVTYHTLHGLNANALKPEGNNWPTNIWNWSEGNYYGIVDHLGYVYTDYCFQPSGIGKLWIDTYFQSDTSIGYNFRITCYDRNTSSAVVSWSSKTAPGGQSSPSAVSFYNLNSNHTYFFEFENTQGYGEIKGTFDIEQQNS